MTPLQDLLHRSAPPAHDRSVRLRAAAWLASLGCMLGVPTYRGAMIGHIDRQFTVPEGILAEMNADEGTFRLLESAVA